MNDLALGIVIGAWSNAALVTGAWLWMELRERARIRSLPNPPDPCVICDGSGIMEIEFHYGTVVEPCDACQVVDF